MSEQEVREQVIEVVAQELGHDADKITDDTSFINDLGADSLDMVEMAMNLEDKFGVQIPEDAMQRIQTVGDAIQFIVEESSNN